MEFQNKRAIRELRENEKQAQKMNKHEASDFNSNGNLVRSIERQEELGNNRDLFNTIYGKNSEDYPAMR